MKAKRVYEFKRGTDITTTLGVGKIKEVKELLDRQFKETNPFTYKIHSLDNIEIFVENPDDWAESTNEEMKTKKPWFIEYTSIDMFSKKYRPRDDSWGGSGPTWIINKAYINSDKAFWDYSEKQRGEIINYTGHLNIPDEEDADVIVAAMNKHYGPVYGFVIKGTKLE